jgi:uncharacterized protein YcgI (DUF1989 family)
MAIINTKRSYTEYIVDAAQSEFALGFKDYNRDNKDVIHTTIDDKDPTTLGYTITRISPTVIKLDPAVPVATPPHIVRLQRETNIDESFHNFTDGAQWNAKSMDENFEQIRHSQQESRDGFIKLRDDVVPLVDGLEEALETASEASQAAQEAADAAIVAASKTQYYLRYYDPAVIYPEFARIMLTNGEWVRAKKETTTNPNLDMTDWVNETREDWFQNYGIKPPEKPSEYLNRKKITAILKTDGTDQYSTLQAYAFAAKTLRLGVELPAGTITYTDTLLVDFPFYLSGSGRDVTILQFKNTVANKPAMKFVRGATKSWFEHLTLREENFNTSIGIQMTDSRTDVGAPCWKNTFTNMECTGFNIGVNFTSTNPLDGTTHAHCDGNTFSEFRFVNCKLSVLNQNCQAINNTFIAFNINNFDTAWVDGQVKVDNNFVMFRDEAGGGINIYGADLIGRGKLFEWHYPAGGSGLFSGSGVFSGQDLRMELRETHNGILVHETVHGNTGVSMSMSISLKNVKTVNYGASIDILRCGGRLKAHLEDVSTVAGTGRLNIRLYPTLGRTSNTTIGSLTDILADNCGNLYYEKETTSPYGTYNRAATPSVIINGSHTSSVNATYTLDAQSFRLLQHGGDIRQLPQGFGHTAGSNGRVVFNNDDPSSGFVTGSQLKFRLPKYARPLKMIMYKQAVRHANEASVDLYVVKDVANWVNPASFDITKDAAIVSTGPLTINKSGYFEVPVNLLSNIVGNAFQSGFDNWTEGRMVFVTKGTITYSGFFGLDYI